MALLGTRVHGVVVVAFPPPESKPSRTEGGNPGSEPSRTEGGNPGSKPSRTVGGKPGVKGVTGRSSCHTPNGSCMEARAGRLTLYCTLQ